MVTAISLTAVETIRFLQVDEFDNSYNEDQDITTRSIMQGILKNSDLSDCDSNEASDQVIPNNFNDAPSSINRWNTLLSGACVT